MNQYLIKYIRYDMPDGYIGCVTKWARGEKEAVKLLLKKAPDRDGGCVFKRGGYGKILSTEKL